MIFHNGVSFPYIPTIFLHLHLPRRKHCVRRWRKSSVLRHPLTFGHLDNLIKSNKALSRSPKHTPFTSEKTEKTEEAHLRNPNTRLCFLPPPPQPDRRSLTAGAALRQKLTPSPDSFLSHRILLLLPLAGFSSCSRLHRILLLPKSPLAQVTGFFPRACEHAGATQRV
ncbi:hypothetical protein ACB094_01G329800 [Castanea mollissima]